MPSFTTICPICKNKIIGSRYSDEQGIYEQYVKCPVCNYSDEFLYGNLVTIIGNKCFIHNYNDSYNKTCLLSTKRKRNMYTACRRWKKYHKGVTYDYSKFPKER